MLEVATPRPGIKWFVVDGGPINVIESTGAAMLEALAGDLRARGIRLGFANLRTEVQGLLEHSGVKAALRERARFSGKQPALQGGHRRFARSGRAEVVKAFKHGKSRVAATLGEFLAAAETAGRWRRTGIVLMLKPDVRKSGIDEFTPEDQFDIKGSYTKQLARTPPAAPPIQATPRTSTLPSPAVSRRVGVLG